MSHYIPGAKQLGSQIVAWVPEIDPAVRAACGPREKYLPYFAHDYISLDLGRSQDQTHAITEAARGFAVVNEAGELLDHFETYLEAVVAQAGYVAREAVATQYVLLTEEEIEAAEKPKRRTRKVTA